MVWKSTSRKRKSSRKSGSERSLTEKSSLKRKQDHVKLISGLFHRAGFSSVPGVENVHFEFKAARSEFDGCFLYENILIFLEFTTSNASSVGAHIKGKQGIYQRIAADPTAFITYFRGYSRKFNDALAEKYQNPEIQVRIVYCSLIPPNSEHKELVPFVKFLDYNVAMYFDKMTKAARFSSRYELFDFLDIEATKVGDRIFSPSLVSSEDIPCSILPEGHSNFGLGFKVVTFYVQPKSILERAYVLRRYGWRDETYSYQRMIDGKKIQNIRDHLLKERRVFINNIIATLPHDTQLLGPNSHTVDPSSITSTQPGTIKLPHRFNSVGLIDGQHRVFSYHEGGTNESVMESLRMRQNLLVTGIIFPDNLSEEDRLKFQATLFVEINSNQSSAKSELKQEIALMLNLFSGDAIARRVITRLNNHNGPLQDQFQRFFFEREKIKTSSVVSFALKPLTSLQSDGSLFNLWSDDARLGMKDGTDVAALSSYIDFCTLEINLIFAAFRSHLRDRWTPDRSQPGFFLTVRNVNGVMALLRHVVKSGKKYSYDEYRAMLSDVGSFDFDSFGSSKYNAMGAALYSRFINRNEQDS